MRCYVFLDLDDTLFQTRPKCPPGVELRPAAHQPDGAPLSFMTPQQTGLFDLLTASATIIPTTARNLNAFRQVRLPFSSYAILDFGGVILLPDGSPDPEWDAHMRPLALSVADELASWHRSLQTFIDNHSLGVRVRVLGDLGMSLYIVMKHPHGDLSALDRVRNEALTELDRERYFVHANDNNLSIVPRFLGKEQTVRYLLDNHLSDQPRLTIGVADSDTDSAFLALCDYVMLPSHSQLALHLPYRDSPRQG